MKRSSLIAASDHKAEVTSHNKATSRAAPFFTTGHNNGKVHSCQMSDAELLARMKGVQDTIENAAGPGLLGGKSNPRRRQMNTWRQPVVAEANKGEEFCYVS